MNDRTSIHDAIFNEELHQEEKWGEQNHNNYKWLAILIEEIGEISKAMLENDHSNIEKEIIQSAAVCVTWLDCLGRTSH